MLFKQSEHEVFLLTMCRYTGLILFVMTYSWMMYDKTQRAKRMSTKPTSAMCVLQRFHSLIFKMTVLIQTVLSILLNSSKMYWNSC